LSGDWHRVLIYNPARQEILNWPLEARKDLGGILTRLQRGIRVGYPDTDSMKTVAPGVFEIRLKSVSGIFRAFYMVEPMHGILVFHAFRKKSQKTPGREIELARGRLRLFLKELASEKDKA
jgi:phage-related protein